MDGCEGIEINNCMKQQMAEAKAENTRGMRRQRKKGERRRDQRRVRMKDKNGKEERQNTSIKKNVVQPVNKTGTCGLYLNLRVY